MGAHVRGIWAFLSGGSFASVSGRAENAAGQGEAFAVLTDASFWEYNPALSGLWQDLLTSGAAAGAA